MIIIFTTEISHFGIVNSRPVEEMLGFFRRYAALWMCLIVFIYGIYLNIITITLKWWQLMGLPLSYPGVPKDKKTTTQKRKTNQCYIYSTWSKNVFSKSTMCGCLGAGGLGRRQCLEAESGSLDPSDVSSCQNSNFSFIVKGYIVFPCFGCVISMTLWKMDGWMDGSIMYPSLFHFTRKRGSFLQCPHIILPQRRISLPAD